ncbi:MAG: nitrogenase [Acaryochloridaceae cyanobacterium RL_2_7]|nr:nitrogenase [Acaryochloridaceae cyanobacterium RL_2_7]
MRWFIPDHPDKNLGNLEINIPLPKINPFHCLINWFIVKKSRLQPIKDHLLAINVEDVTRAHLVCKLIPSQCPFERRIQLFKWQLHIPPLCHFNPFYNEFVMLRFRALSYLSDVCGEDVTRYCH